MSNEILGSYIYNYASREISAADWELIPTAMRLVNPVTLGGAMRAVTSKKGLLRYETNAEGDHCLLVLREESGKIKAYTVKVYADKTTTFSSNRKAVTRKADFRQTIWQSPDFDQLVDDPEIVHDWENRVDALIGRITEQLVNQNLIAWLRQQCRASTIKKEGGSYFVPSQFMSRLEDYMRVFGEWQQVQWLDVARTGNSLANVAKGTQEDLIAQVGKLLENVESIKTSRGFESKLSELNAMHESMVFYEGILDVTLEDLRSAMADAQKIVEDGLHDAKLVEKWTR